jgi:LmbE family N-acetylglucosaminyl deacetylase
MAQQNQATALAFFAHPDDAEILCAGTLARLHAEASYRVVIATATSGDAGSSTLRPDEISRIRAEEAVASARLLDGQYVCAGCQDLFVCYDRPTIQKFVEIVRRAGPWIVFTHSPDDYMIDHEMTSRLVRTACFGAPVPNVLTGSQDAAEVLPAVPHLYYADPLEGIDIFGRPIEPDLIIDITATMALKEKMLGAHASQREWLRAQHGIDEYILSMKQWGQHRGQRIGAAFGEGFRQHKGHAYPQGDLLGQLLNGRRRDGVTT